MKRDYKMHVNISKICLYDLQVCCSIVLHLGHLRSKKGLFEETLRSSASTQPQSFNSSILCAALPTEYITRVSTRRSVAIAHADPMAIHIKRTKCTRHILRFRRTVRETAITTIECPRSLNITCTNQDYDFGLTNIVGIT
jgi:hypothetical protein